MDHRPHSDEIDFGDIVRVLLRNVWLIMLSGLVAAAAVHTYFSRQQPVYESSALLLSAGNQTGNQIVNSTLVSAPPLPPGALEGALWSVSVLESIARDVSILPELTVGQRRALQAQLVNAAVPGQRRFFSIDGTVDMNGNGTYTLSAKHTDPVIAARLANFAAEALVEWDTQRGRAKVTAARQAVETQLREVEGRLQREGTLVEPLTRNQRTLMNQRSVRLDEHNDLLALERAVQGSLSMVAPGVPSTWPVAPKPVRNAAMAALFVMLLTAAVLLTRALTNRVVTSDAELRAFNLRTLGEVPHVRRLYKHQSLLATINRSGSSDSVDFLASNVRLSFGNAQPKILLVTSLLPGDGKSTIAAGVASALAEKGSRVLLIDADVRRPSQRAIWSVAAESAEWVDLPGGHPTLLEEARDLQSALQFPEAAQARRLRSNLHLVVPHSPKVQNAKARLPLEEFSLRLPNWAQEYDIVILDAPPALATADPLVLAQLSTGVLLVLQPGKASVLGLRRLVDALTLVEANVLGVAFNKVDPRSQKTGYGYGYGYQVPSRRKRSGAPESP